MSITLSRCSSPLIVSQGAGVWRAPFNCMDAVLNSVSMVRVDFPPPETPVTLTRTDGNLAYSIKLSVDDNYMITAEQSVTNTAEEGAAVIQPFALINRTSVNATPDEFLSHAGPIGVFDEVLNDPNSYDDLVDIKTWSPSGSPFAMSRSCSATTTVTMSTTRMWSRMSRNRPARRLGKPVIPGSSNSKSSSPLGSRRG